MNQTRQYDFDRLYVRLLGPLQVVRSHEEINLGPLRQQAVLLPLVLRPSRTVTREEILDGVWGAAVPTSGAALVRTYVSRLRLILGRDMIVRCPVGYYIRLNPGQIDLTVFDQYLTEARELRRHAQMGPSAAAWRKALELWRGPPLPGIPGPFAENQRQRLTELQLSAQEECWDTEIALGKHTELVVDLSAAVRGQPLRENLTRLLMLASCRSGRQANAVAAFEQIRYRLDEELGVQPAPALQQLYDRIRSGDPDVM